MSGSHGNTSTATQHLSYILHDGTCRFVKELGSFAAGEAYRSRLLVLTDMPQPSRGLALDFSSFIGPLFFVWLLQLPLPVVCALCAVRFNTTSENGALLHRYCAARVGL